MILDVCVSVHDTFNAKRWHLSVEKLSYVGVGSRILVPTLLDVAAKYCRYVLIAFDHFPFYQNTVTSLTRFLRVVP